MGGLRPAVLTLLFAVFTRAEVCKNYGACRQETFHQTRSGLKIMLFGSTYLEDPGLGRGFYTNTVMVKRPRLSQELL